MRDIREDLFERMEAATAEMAAARTQYDLERREVERRFQRIFEDIGGRQKAIVVLLDEEAKSHGPHAKSISPHTELRLPFAEFIMNGIEATGSMSKEDAKDMAERAGYGDGEGVGRMVHTTLLNLKNAGKLQLLADGQYQAAHRDLSRLTEVPGYLRNRKPRILDLGDSSKKENSPADKAGEFQGIFK